MNIENIAIMCKDLNQRNEAEKVLINHGLVNDNNHTGNKNITVGVGQVFWFSDRPNGSKISFDEFMEKYSENEMIKKIHQAKKELGLNNSELSLKMGKSRPYIAKMLNQPQSEKVQNKVIAELDKLLNQPEVDDTFVSNLADEIESKDKEISDLKKVIESKDLAISGLIKQNDEAKKIHDKDVKIISEKQDQIDRLKSIKDHDSYQISELSKALEYGENSHEANVDSLKSKIKRERIIILIVIAILTALFFLKGSIGG